VGVGYKKSFDKLNHYGLFLKLIDILIPSSLLLVLEHWFIISATCVRWCDDFSEFFTVACCVQQGGVLSPYLFAIYVDEIVAKQIAYVRSLLQTRPKGYCHYLIYSDDILLLAPSVESL